jgi:hypothetical protein
MDPIMEEEVVVGPITAQEGGLPVQVGWEVVDELGRMDRLFWIRLQAQPIQEEVEVVVVQQTNMSAQEPPVVQVFSSFHIKKSRKSYSPFEMDVMIQ